MDEMEMEPKAEELFGHFESYAEDMPLGEALALAEIFQTRVDAYVAALTDDLRRKG